MKENWADTPEYEGLYLISDKGRVKSLPRAGAWCERIRKQGIKRGYKTVTLCKEGIRKEFLVHRLVWSAFKGEIPEGYVVNHLNEIKTDNRLENLEICTSTENMNYGTRNERISKAMAVSAKGNTYRRKMIVLRALKSCEIYSFSSSYEASAFFGHGKTYVGLLIHEARKKNSNKIKLKGNEYYFKQL